MFYTGSCKFQYLFQLLRNKTAKKQNNQYYRIRPNYRPCPHIPPPPDFLFIFTHYHPFDDLFPDFFLFFTYYRPLDNLLALVVENKFT